MKKLLILIGLCIFFIEAQSQVFYKRDSLDVVTLEIPSQFKAYTYNKYNLTDSSLIISSKSDSIDLYMKHLDGDKTLRFVFGDDNKDLISSSNKYNLETGQSAHFTIKASKDYSLKSNLKIYPDFIIDNTGTFNEVSSSPALLFKMEAKHIYGFKYIGETCGQKDLNIQIFKDSVLIEQKNIEISIDKAEIKFAIETEIIPGNSQYDIACHISSSSPVICDIPVRIILTLELNGFRENVEKDITIQKGTSNYQDHIIRKIAGRRPRSFIVKEAKVIPIINGINNHYTMSDKN